jgi:hypothetical protein
VSFVAFFVRRSSANNYGGRFINTGTANVEKRGLFFLTPHQLVPHYDRYATMAFHVYPVVVLRWNEFHFALCIMQ